MPAARNYSWKTAGVCLLLGGLTWLVFAQTLGHQFVNYDDEAYVYRNPDIARGLTFQGMSWAFTHLVSGNWHPLTAISHMLDCRSYGLNAGGHHFTNVLLHTVAVILLFFILRQMTGAFWRSAFVAAIFAIHPLRVESVAWVAERKDVLSAVFFMLTLGAYIRYARKPSIVRYLTMSILFACGLMAKQMLVTLPFVLLLLDYWPLNRSQNSEPRGPKPKNQNAKLKSQSWINLIVEKIPLLILSAAGCVATLIAQGQSINVMEKLSLPWRVSNAAVTLIVYIWQMVWPLRLGVFYPHRRDSLPLWEVSLSIVFFVAISAAALALRKKRPYFLTGWFWYLGMLVPVIGIVQVGLQAHADRYTYLPQIGLYLAITWGIVDLSVSWRYRREILGVAAAIIVVALAWCSWIQTSYWRNSERLWRRTLAAAPNNDAAHTALSSALLDKGRSDEAIAQAKLALNIRPESAEAHSNLGAAYSRKGDLSEALVHFQKSLELDPNLPRLHYNIANVLFQKGEVDEAIAHYEKELESQPGFAEAHNNLANVLLRKGQLDEAIVHLRRALQSNPNYAEACNNLAVALSQKGGMAEAIAQWEKALQIEPENADAQCNLAWVFATYPEGSIRDGVKAVDHAQRAIQLSGGKNPRIWRLLAAAYAENGRFADAVSAARTGLRFATAEGDLSLVHTLEMNIALFQANSPLRDINRPSSSGQ